MQGPSGDTQRVFSGGNSVKFISVLPVDLAQTEPTCSDHAPPNCTVCPQTFIYFFFFGGEGGGAQAVFGKAEISTLWLIPDF